MSHPQDSSDASASHSAQYGRPLSLIEASDADETTQESAVSAQRRQNVPSSNHEYRRSFQDLQDQIYDLFQQFVPSRSSGSRGADENAGSESPSARTVLCADLPRLLRAFEDKRGFPLIEDDSREQLELYCNQVPDHPISCDDLVNMIQGLEGARMAQDDARSDTSSSDREETEGNGRIRSGSSSSSASSSEARNPSSRPTSPDPSLHAASPPKSSTPIKTSPSPAPFPRSSSMEGDPADATIGPDSDRIPSPGYRAGRGRMSDSIVVQHRSRTTSGSGIPDDGDPKRERRRSQMDSTRQEDKDVLRGKGRAPPSSWQRPKPQALAARSRRTSDVSASSSSNHDPGTSSPDGNFTRPRQVSQPMPPLITDEGDAPAFPRSVSTGFSFPRATSDHAGDDSWYAEQEEKWERMSERDRARSSASRGASPDLEGPGANYQPFGLRSPIGSSPRHSFGRPRYQDWEGSHHADTEELADLQRRYDQLVHALQDKEKAFEDTQNAADTTIADLETKVETLQTKLSSLSKTNEEMKQREQKYLDEISRLENDLATSEKMYKVMERTKEVQAADLTFREAKLNTLQGKVNELQERIATAQRDEADHYSRECEWDKDREEYRRQLEQLRAQLSEAVVRDARVQELESEREALQAKLRELTSELEEARRGSGIFVPGSAASVPTGTSKRLGAELAKVFDEVADNAEVGSAEGESTAEDEDSGDESVIVTTTRRRRRRDAAPRILTERSTQTVPDEDTSAPSEPSPPTYDEAAMEKTILTRCHPAKASGESAQLSMAGSFGPSLFDFIMGSPSSELPEQTPAKQYEAVTEHLRLRCTVLEEALEKEHGAESSVTRESAKASGSSAVATSESDGAPKSARRRRSASAAASFVPRRLVSGATRLFNVLPSPAQDGLNSFARQSEALSPGARLLFWSSGILVCGFIVGGVVTGGDTHHHYHSASGAFEDAASWQLLNSLHALGYEDGMLAEAGGFLSRLFMGSAMRVAGTPV